MIRRAARLVLAGWTALSIALVGWSGYQIAANPLMAPFAAATAEQIVAATDRMMLASATPDALAARITTRLGESPRNWVAIDALVGLAQEQGTALPPDLLAQVAAARDADHSLLAAAGACAACAYDPAACTLSNVLICQVPIAITPVGDVLTLTRAGIAYSQGQEVDRLDVGLALLSLGATAAIMATRGGSEAVATGAGLTRVAARMRLLSPRLARMVVRAVDEGVDWPRLARASAAEDVTAALRSRAFAPLAETVGDLDRLRRATSTREALYLLPLIDDATDARRMATAAEALGPRLVARAEVLGKARLLRTTVRISHIGWSMLTGLWGLLLGLASFAQGAGHIVLRRGLKRLARGPVNTPARR